LGLEAQRFEIEAFGARREEHPVTAKIKRPGVCGTLAASGSEGPAYSALLSR
jgi:hypothetical protein